MSVQRRKYDSDFKRNAFQLSMETGRTVCLVSLEIFFIGEKESTEQNKTVHCFPVVAKKRLPIKKSIVELLKRNSRMLIMERDILKKSHGHFQQSIEMNFQFIQDNRKGISSASSAKRRSRALRIRL